MRRCSSNGEIWGPSAHCSHQRVTTKLFSWAHCRRPPTDEMMEKVEEAVVPVSFGSNGCKGRRGEEEGQARRACGSNLRQGLGGAMHQRVRTTTTRLWSQFPAQGSLFTRNATRIRPPRERNWVGPRRQPISGGARDELQM